MKAHDPAGPWKETGVVPLAEIVVVDRAGNLLFAAENEASAIRRGGLIAQRHPHLLPLAVRPVPRATIAKPDGGP